MNPNKYEMTKACDSEKKKRVKEIHMDTKKQLRI